MTDRISPTRSEADLLKVAQDAPLAEIKTAYRKAALAHHPDQNPHPEAARHFRQITEAYKILEARALKRESSKPRKEIPLGDRVSFFLGDVGSLVRRWTPQRWSKVVDGLPAVVWVSSSLEVLARAWPGAPPPRPVPPSFEGIRAALEAWAGRTAEWPLPVPLEKAQKEPLEKALLAAERRLKALDRPSRRR